MNNIPEEIHSFIKDINFLTQKENITLAVAILSLYSEYIVNRLIKRNFNEGLDKEKDFSLSHKLKILKGASIIADSEYKNLDALRRLRNELLHNLDIDTDKIEKIMGEIELNFVQEERRAYFEEMHPLTKFLWAVISKIFYLLTKLYNAEHLALESNGKLFYLRNLNIKENANNQIF